MFIWKQKAEGKIQVSDFDYRSKETIEKRTKCREIIVWETFLAIFLSQMMGSAFRQVRLSS